MLTLSFAYSQDSVLLPYIQVTQFSNKIQLNKQEIQNLGQTSDILKLVPGFNVRNYSGLGSGSQIYFHGSSSEHIKVYLDGILLSNHESPVDLSKIPLELIENVKITYGFSEELLEEGIATVFLSTKKHKPSLVLKAGIGSFSTYQFSIHRFQTINPYFNINLSGVWENAKNNFPYHDNRGTEFNTKDDKINFRKNNQYQNITINTRLTWKWKQQDLNQQFYFQKNTKHFPSFNQNSKAFTTTQLYQIKNNWTRYFKKHQHKLSLELQYRHEQHKDPQLSSSFQAYELERMITVFKLSYHWNYQINTKYYIQSTATYQNQKFKDIDLDSVFFITAPPSASHHKATFLHRQNYRLLKQLKTNLQAGFHYQIWEADSFSFLAQNTLPYSVKSFTWQGALQTVWQLGLSNIEAHLHQKKTISTQLRIIG